MTTCIHIKDGDKKTSNWSGGSTTELFIYPPDSTYAKRNFLFRISSATVDVEKSVFTPLPEYHRILLVLEGNIRLLHEIQEGETEILHHERSLFPLEQDSFEGEYYTTCYGTCMDFNIMTAKHLFPKISVTSMNQEERQSFSLEWADFFYVIRGSAIVSKGKENRLILKDGELCVFLQDIKKKDDVTSRKESIDIVSDSENLVMITGTIRS